MCLTVRDVCASAKLGSAIADNQAANNKDTQDRSSTSELFCVLGKQSNCVSTHLVRKIHQPITYSKLRDVKDDEEQERCKDIAGDCHVRGNTSSNWNKGEPEQCVTNAAQRTHCRNADCTNGWDIQLVLLKGENNTHNKGDQEWVGIKELKVVTHGSSKVILVVAVNLLKTRKDTVEPTSCLHSLVVEGSLQEQGAPYHLVERLLIKWLSRSGVLIGIRNIKCHLRSHLQQQQQEQHSSSWSGAGNPRMRYQSR